VYLKEEEDHIEEQEESEEQDEEEELPPSLTVEQSLFKSNITHEIEDINKPPKKSQFFS
jgi:hypothetical protein